MEELPKLDLKKTAMINNFLLKQPSILEEDDKRAEENLSFLERTPGMGILLTILGICIYQGGNVVAKKMTVNPFMMIFLRDFLTLFYTLPFTVQARTTPFPRGWPAQLDMMLLVEKYLDVQEPSLSALSEVFLWGFSSQVISTPSGEK